MIPSAAFAVDPVPIDIAEQAGAIIYDLYGAANNTSLAFDSIQPGPALTEIITLFQESQATTGGEPISMAAIGTALLAAGAIAVVYDASNSVYNLVVDLDYDNFGEFYQDFNNGWDYILSDVAGFVRDSVSDLFNWSSSNDSIELVVINPANIYSVPYYTGTNVLNMYQNGNKFFDNDFYKYAISTDYSDPLYFAVVSNASSYQIVCFRESTSLSPSNNKANIPIVRENDTAYASTYVLLDGAGNLSNGMKYYTTNISFIGGVSDSSQFTVPIFTSINDAISHVIEWTNELQPGNINLMPNNLFIGNPLHNPLEITIPNPSSPMPYGQPIHIGTDIVVDPGLLPENVPTNPTPGVAYPITDPDSLSEIIPGVWEDLVAGDVAIDPDPQFDVDTGSDPAPEDPNPDLNLNPEDVVIPYIPIKLPSFRFNFKSIWHYVRDWVASLSQFFKLISLVWSRLPYPIVLPIYATLVIVIVIGVWRRFVS